DQGRHVRPPARIHDRRRGAEHTEAEGEHRALGHDGDRALTDHRLRPGVGHLALRDRPQLDAEGCGASQRCHRGALRPCRETAGAHARWVGGPRRGRAMSTMEPVGKAALIASVGGQGGYSDGTNAAHGLRRLLSEFIGTVGLTFVLSGGAAILVRSGGEPLQPWQTVAVLSAVSALWLVVAVYFLGDISAHFNPVTTLAFALRRDMGWVMTAVYWVVQFVAAAAGSFPPPGFFA